MKKFDRLILTAIIMYMLAALSAGYFVWNQYEQTDRVYLVETNRLIYEVVDALRDSSGTADENHRENDLQEEKDKDMQRSVLHISPDKYQYIHAFRFLPASEKQQEVITDFYQRKSGLRDSIVEIVPIYLDHELAGYLRMDIERTSSRLNIMIVVELSILVLAVFILAILFYIRAHIIAPFGRMQELSHELARGNLKGDIKQEKQQYFGQFERSLSQLRDELEGKRKRELELLRERKLLMLSLSHDIKTPLATIKLYNRALEQGEYDSPEKRLAIYHQIALKSNEIEKYMEELLTSSREEILDISVEEGKFYLRELLDHVLSVYREKCKLRKIELTVGAYENHLFQGDLHRMVEVFENLFENAFKYGDGRRIEITFEEEDACQLIRVFNTGDPVAENDFAHLFESFFRGTNTHGRQGYGLGLYITREIMHKMGGEIFAESAKDGMIFVVVLPL